jgi:hypothetical protein|eukprot:COSAG01_NODE_935_length_12642_cov_37.069361_13_plen_94_part_00
MSEVVEIVEKYGITTRRSAVAASTSGGRHRRRVTRQRIVVMRLKDGRGWVSALTVRATCPPWPHSRPRHSAMTMRVHTQADLCRGSIRDPVPI